MRRIAKILPPAYYSEPAYTERFGAAKTVPYIQKNHISEIHLYIYIYILQGRALIINTNNSYLHYGQTKL